MRRLDGPRGCPNLSDQRPVTCRGGGGAHGGLAGKATERRSQPCPHPDRGLRAPGRGDSFLLLQPPPGLQSAVTAAGAEPQGHACSHGSPGTARAHGARQLSHHGRGLPSGLRDQPRRQQPLPAPRPWGRTPPSGHTHTPPLPARGTIGRKERTAFRFGATRPSRAPRCLQRPRSPLPNPCTPSRRGSLRAPARLDSRAEQEGAGGGGTAGEEAPPQASPTHR